MVKDKPFYGREAMWSPACDRRLVGLRLKERGIARQGYKIVTPDGDAIGEVTSGALSPLTRDCIAFAWVDAEHVSDGGEVHVEVRGRALAAEIVKPPFYMA